MPLKILLADDHLVLLAGMRALLEREGYQVVADVSDGRQAVNLARRLQPHIAVLDITMPGRGGIEFIRDLLAPPVPGDQGHHPDHAQ